MDFIREIIQEEIERLISEVSHKKAKFKRRNRHKPDIPEPGHKPDKDHRYSEEDHYRYEKILKKIKSDPDNGNKSEKELKRLAAKQFNIEKYGNRQNRTRKKVGGGTESYNLKDYQRLNGTISDSDAEQIRSRIDQKATDIAYVARKVFPHHTDEGAQSQLRKILNGERPMTKRVYNKLSSMIDSGEIAVKTE
jgi:hypothetical protein